MIIENIQVTEPNPEGMKYLTRYGTESRRDEISHPFGIKSTAATRIIPAKYKAHPPAQAWHHQSNQAAQSLQ